MASLLGDSLKLPCGVELINRIGKSATTECLAHASTGNPNESLCTLYERWSAGKPGLLITGNVMVDRRYREAPRNLCLDHQSCLNSYKTLVQSVRNACNGVAFVAQLSHPGRQTTIATSFHCVAPSPVRVSIPGAPPVFPTPRELKDNEIIEIIDKFVTSALLAKEVGFDGIQIHGAHGYLISQFLSPHSNKRNDKWGKDEESRSLFLLEILQKTRKAVGNDFIIGIKLNSADFRRGGFTEEQSMNLIEKLSKQSLDFVEISGGTYESAEMMKNPSDASSEKEAFFIDFASKVRERVPDIPLMLTGGFRSLDVMKWALSKNYIDIVGMARPFCLDPDVPKKLISGDISTVPSYNLTFGPAMFKTVTGPALNNFWHQRQIKLISAGKSPNKNVGFIYCLTVMFFRSYIWDWQFYPKRNTFLFLTAIFLSAYYFKSSFL